MFTIFDEEWIYREHLYLALNKPANFECSRKPSHYLGVLTLLPEQLTWRDVQPVGRLDLCKIHFLHFLKFVNQLFF